MRHVLTWWQGGYWEAKAGGDWGKHGLTSIYDVTGVTAPPSGAGL